MIDGFHHLANPTPALADFPFGHKYLEISLRPSLVVDQRAIALGKGSRRQDQVGSGDGGSIAGFERDHVFRCPEKFICESPIGAGVKFIFEGLKVSRTMVFSTTAVTVAPVK